MLRIRHLSSWRKCIADNEKGDQSSHMFTSYYLVVYSIHIIPIEHNYQVNQWGFRFRTFAARGI